MRRKDLLGKYLRLPSRTGEVGVLHATRLLPFFVEKWSIANSE